MRGSLGGACSAPWERPARSPCCRGARRPATAAARPAAGASRSAWSCRSPASTQGVLEAYAAVRRVKAGYIMRDVARLAADRGVPFVPFDALPNATLARLVAHRLNRRAPDAVQPFVLGTWRALFADGADIGSVEVLKRALDPRLHPEIEAAQDDGQAAEDLETANRDALAAGCFGAPWIVADGEAYFGQDRLYLLDHRLARGAG